jgi:hypothetical protein
LPDLAQRLRGTFAGRYRIERELGRGRLAMLFVVERQTAKQVRREVSVGPLHFGETP